MVKIFFPYKTSLKPVVQFLIRYTKAISISLGILLFLLLIFKLYENSSQKDTLRVANELNLLLAKHQGIERLTALKNYLSKMQKQLCTTVRLELVRAAVEQKDWPLAVATWKELIARNDPTLAALAAIGQAQAQLAAGQTKEAMAALDAVQAAAPKSFERVIGQMLAQAAEISQNYVRAIAIYQGLLQNTDDRTKIFLEDKLARLSRKNGQ
ncbi:hypothetical protein DSUL_160034 [Desulfovibrionales bacterium]